ncbi:hypothetical protein ACQPZJ_24245 [Actinoplanes sp. CA-054009]
MGNDLEVCRVVLSLYSARFPIRQAEVVERAPDMRMVPRLTPGIDFRLIEEAGGWLTFESVQIVTVEGDRILERPVTAADKPYPPYRLARDSSISADEWAGVVARPGDFGWETRIEARLPSGVGGSRARPSRFMWLRMRASRCWSPASSARTACGRSRPCSALGSVTALESVSEDVRRHAVSDFDALDVG